MLRPRSSERRPSSPSFPPSSELGFDSSDEPVTSDRPSGLNAEAGPERVTVPEGSLPPSAPTAQASGSEEISPVTSKSSAQGKNDETDFSDGQLAEPKQVVEAEAAKVEPVSSVPVREPNKLEIAKLEPRKVPAQKVEATKIETTTEAPTKVDQVQAEAAKRDAAKADEAEVEAIRLATAKLEAAKVEAAKVEAAKVEAAKVEAAKVEAGKVEAARVEAAKVEAAAKTNKDKKKNKSKGGVVQAGKPSAIVSDEDDHELSTHDFFQSSSDSLQPMVDAAEPEVDERPAPPTAESIAHRARLKKIVGGVLAAAALVALIGIGKTLVMAKSASAQDRSSASQVATTPDRSAAEEAKKAADAKAREEAAQQAKADEAKKAADAKGVEDAKKADLATEQAKVDDKAANDKTGADDTKKNDDKGADAKADAKAGDAAADAKKDDAPKTALSPADVKELKKKASIAINSGNNKAAIETANAAIAADPEDAMMYLYLGSAYLNLGDAKGAREAFNDCVKNSKTGPKYECIQMGGHK